MRKSKILSILIFTCILVLNICFGANNKIYAAGTADLSKSEYSTTLNPFSAYAYSNVGCTWYAWGRAYEVLGVNLPVLGNAVTWYDTLAQKGYAVGSQPKANSIVVWRDSGAGHVAFVEAVDGSNVYYTEGGWTGNGGGYGGCQYCHYTTSPLSKMSVGTNRWEGTNYTPQYVVGYVYLNGSTPSGFDYNVQSTGVTDITDNNAIMRGHINTSAAISSGMSVGVYIGLSPNSFTMGHLEAVSQAAYNLTGKGGFDFWFDLNKETSIRLAPGQKYYYKFCVKYNGVEKCTDVYSFETADYEKPVISNVKVSDINETGYTVSCTVTDNAGIARVSFPTWTVANNQDDLLWGEPTSVKGSTYTYRVNINDHNKEYGSYVTHIYAYDNRGNSAKAELNIVNIYKKITAGLKTNTTSCTTGTTVILYASASGGSGGYSYRYYVRKKNAASWTELKAASAQSNVCSWTEKNSGQYELMTEVKDSAGNSAKSSIVNVTVNDKPLTITASISASSIIKGGKLTVSSKATGGDGSYRYTCQIYNKNTNEWTYPLYLSSSATYICTPEKAGDYDVFMRVHDGNGKTELTRAMNVKVIEPELSITGKSSVSTVTKGGKVTVSGTAKGGSGAYTYSYLIHNTDTNEWFRLTSDFISSNTFTWTAGSAGNREFFVEVKDNTNKVMRSNAIKVKVIAEPLSITAKANVATVSQNGKVVINGNAKGGSGKYTYSYLIHNTDTNQWSRLTSSFINNNNYTWSAGSTGNREFFVEVKDNTGNVARSSAVKVAVINPLKITAKASATSIVVGNKAVITGTATGGTGKYTYSYLIHNKDTNQWSRLTPSFVASNKYTWTAGSMGNREFFVEVKDSSGKVMRSNVVNIAVAGKPLAITGKASASAVTKGGKVMISGIASGGSQKYTYSFLVHNKDTNQWSRLSSFENSSTYIWTAGSAGNREFFVEVKDSSGKVVRSNAINVKVDNTMNERAQLAGRWNLSTVFDSAGKQYSPRRFYGSIIYAGSGYGAYFDFDRNGNFKCYIEDSESGNGTYLINGNKIYLSFTNRSSSYACEKVLTWKEDGSLLYINYCAGNGTVSAKNKINNYFEKVNN